MRLAPAAVLVLLAVSGCSHGVSHPVSVRPNGKGTQAPRPIVTAKPARVANPHVVVPNACSVLTGDDVSRFFAPQPSLLQSDDGDSSCIYPDKHGRGNVTITVSRVFGQPDWATFVKTDRDTGIQAVSGLGPEAIRGYYTLTGYDTSEVIWRGPDLQYDLLFNGKIGLGDQKVNVVPLAQRIYSRTS